jgi:hypothetical protein
VLFGVSNGEALPTLVCCRRISATESIDGDERRCFGEAVCPGTVILACCALVDHVR